MILQRYNVSVHTCKHQIFMKTEENNNPKGNQRNEDTKSTNPSVTPGTGNQNQDNSKSPQGQEKEPWKNPDPTTPEKRQDIYAEKKEDSAEGKEDSDNSTDTEEDEDSNPEANTTNTPSNTPRKEDNDIDKKYDNQINP